MLDAPVRRLSDAKQTNNTDHDVPLTISRGCRCLPAYHPLPFFQHVVMLTLCSFPPNLSFGTRELIK